MPDEVKTSLYIWDHYLLPLLSNEIRNTWLETVDSDDFNDVPYKLKHTTQKHTVTSDR